MLLAVYSDDGSGKPQYLRAVSEETAVNSTAGWQTIELIQPILAKKGTKIWLSWVFESNPGVRYIAGTPGRASSGQAWAYGMPATFGSSTVASYKYSICANYTVEDDAPQVTLIGNPYMYTARAYDIETGLYYYRARYYNPHIGRFLQVDPARDGMNWYAYCGNNSINCVDPMGLFKEYYIDFFNDDLNQVHVLVCQDGWGSGEYYEYKFTTYGYLLEAICSGEYPELVPDSCDSSIHFRDGRITQSRFDQIVSALFATDVDMDALTITNYGGTDYYWDWGEIKRGFKEGLEDGIDIAWNHDPCTIAQYGWVGSVSSALGYGGQISGAVAVGLGIGGTIAASTTFNFYSGIGCKFAANGLLATEGTTIQMMFGSTLTAGGTIAKATSAVYAFTAGLAYQCGGNPVYCYQNVSGTLTQYATPPGIWATIEYPILNFMNCPIIYVVWNGKEFVFK